MNPIRHFTAIAAAIVASGGVALAQSAPSAAMSAAPTGAPEAAQAQALTIDTPIETLVATPSAKAVLDADIPGLTEHPMYNQFKRENLRALAAKFGGAISDKDLAKVQTDLAALSSATTSR
jgi:hypothetical protein